MASDLGRLAQVTLLSALLLAVSAASGSQPWFDERNANAAAVDERSHLIPADRSVSAHAGNSGLRMSFSRGVNVYARFRALSPAPPLTERDADLLASLGFTFVRLTVSPELLLGRGAVDPSVLGRLVETVELLQQYGLAAVVDLHPEPAFMRSIATDRDTRQRYLRLVEIVAHTLADQRLSAVALEPLSEPRSPETGRATWDWNALQTELWIAARRAAPSQTLVLTGDAVSTIDGLLHTQAVDDSNVVYDFHFYEPVLFTHQGATWLAPYYQFLTAVPYPSSPGAVSRSADSMLRGVPDAGLRNEARAQLERYDSESWDRGRLLQRLGLAANWARQNDARVIAGEFGVYRKNASPWNRAAWLRDVRELLEEQGIGWAMWDYDYGGFGLLDAAGRLDAVTAAALNVRAFEGAHDGAYCDAISGWAWDRSRPDIAVDVNIYDGELLLATIPADQLRPDLRDAGMGGGLHGFRYPTPPNLRDGQPHAIRVQVAAGGVDLLHTPRTLTCQV